MHESNKLYMLQTGKKTTSRSVKKNKNNFINVIGDKFAMSIGWGKLIISLCTKLFGCINYNWILNWFLTHFMDVHKTVHENVHETKKS